MKLYQASMDGPRDLETTITDMFENRSDAVDAGEKLMRGKLCLSSGKIKEFDTKDIPLFLVYVYHKDGDTRTIIPFHTYEEAKATWDDQWKFLSKIHRPNPYRCDIVPVMEMGNHINMNRQKNHDQSYFTIHPKF
jgi:hypothetical protein